MELLTADEYTAAKQEWTQLTVAGVDPGTVIPPERLVAFWTTHGLNDLFFFVKFVLGYDKLSPRLHREMCRFAERDQPLRRGFIIPRGHYKSTVITIGKTLWDLMRNPEERILMVHERGDQVRQFLAQIRSHLESNRMLNQLYPERIPPWRSKGWRWTADAINIRRPHDWPEPSIFAAGWSSAFQGMHFTTLRFDDLIGEEAAANPDIMEKVVDWVRRSNPLFVNPRDGRLDFVGTRWAYRDVYSWAMETYDDTEWYVRSAIVERRNVDTGEIEKVPLFPEEFTIDLLRKLEKEMGIFSFAAQYLNKPTTGSTQEFNQSWLRYYTKGETVIDGQRTAVVQQRPDDIRTSDETERVPLPALSIYIHVDPGIGLIEGRAKAEGKHSHSAIMVVGIAHPRRIFVLHAWKRVVSVPELNEQILRYYQAYEHYVSKISIESHSWTHMVRPSLLGMAADRGIALSEGRVEPYTKSANTKKEGRIRKLQPYCSNGQVFIEEDMTDFVREYLDFPQAPPWDLMDAFAQGPDYWVFPDTGELDAEDPALFALDACPEDHYTSGRNQLTGY